MTRTGSYRFRLMSLFLALGFWVMTFAIMPLVLRVATPRDHFATLVGVAIYVCAVCGFGFLARAVAGRPVTELLNRGAGMQRPLPRFLYNLLAMLLLMFVLAICMGIPQMEFERAGLVVGP